MIDGQIFFDQPIRNNLIAYDNIRKVSTGQEDDHTTGWLLDYDYLKKIIIWSKSNISDDFYWKFRKQARIFLNTEKAIQTVLNSSQGAAKVF